jgi:hypothetical protein
MLALVGAVTFTPAQAQPDDHKDKTKAKDPVEWSFPTVQGIVQNAYWADGLTKGSHTPTLQVWSDDSNMLVTIYGDTSDVREVIANGTACVGRFVVASGIRIDEAQLSAQGIEVPNLDMECSASIGPEPASAPPDSSASKKKS